MPLRAGWDYFTSATIYSTSYSMRTPKEGNDVDWQFLLSAEKPKIYSFRVEEERDSGKRYSAEEYIVRRDFKEPYWGTEYFIRERYVAIEARDIFYNQISLNYTESNWYGGYALRHVNSVPSHRLVGGYESDRTIAGLVRMRLSAGINTDLDQVDYNVKSEVSFALFKFLQLNSLSIYELADGKQYKQTKIGISVEFPAARK